MLKYLGGEMFWCLQKYFEMYQENKMYGWVEALKRSVMKQTQKNVHGKI